MPKKQAATDVQTEQGRQLARRLFDYRIDLVNKLGPAEKAALLADFPALTEADFDYIVGQVRIARQYQRERVGWQAIPHDITVLVATAAVALFDWRVGIVVGVAVLVLLESLFMVYFNRRLYRYLSFLVWLTFPAYALLAYILYRQGIDTYGIALAVLLAGLGSFVLGSLARLPGRLYMDARRKAKTEAEAAQAQQKKPVRKGR